MDHFGTERALDVIWWACRCHYMTRVADAFQIPLERENVFEGMMQNTSKSSFEKEMRGRMETRTWILAIE